jgi:hypothetical protein
MSKNGVDGSEGKDPISELDSLEGELENLEMKRNVVDANTKRQIAQMRETVRDLRHTFVRLLERQAEQADLPDLIEALNKNSAGLIEAINRSAIDGARTFDAPRAVLSEGEFLREQLAVGRFGTESPGVGFDTAGAPDDPSGLEVLAAALAPSKASRKAS